MIKSNNPEHSYFYKMPDSTISTTSVDGFTLYLKIDKAECIYEVSFDGPYDSPFRDLCAEIEGKTIDEISRKDFYQLAPENNIWLKSYELAVIFEDGLKRMHEKQENVFYYITTLNENYKHPAMPKGVKKEDILKGMYLFKAKNGTKKIKMCVSII